MRLSRRTFIASGFSLAGVGLIGTGGLAVMTSNERMIVAIVKRNLNLAGVSDAEMLEFARTFLTQSVRTSRAKMTVLRLLSPVLEKGGAALKLMPRFLREDLASYERKVFTQFILSTDLLDESREDKQRVSYLGYYDPYSRSCDFPLTQV